jgi:succinate dehydrogenase / fumarate reductase, membrane anchor subunit
MRTPLARVRGLGSAKDGTDDFGKQRLTAISNIPSVIFLVWLIAAAYGRSHAEMAALLSSPLVAVALALALGSFLYHMRIGMQVIIEDYIHAKMLKFPLLIGNLFLVILLAVVAFYSIIRLGLGG